LVANPAGLDAEVVEGAVVVVRRPVEGELVVRGVRLVREFAVEIGRGDHEVAEAHRRIQGQRRLVPAVAQVLLLEPDLVEVARSRSDVAVAVRLGVLVDEPERDVDILRQVPLERCPTAVVSTLLTCP
jgi:hypothetical protein